MALQDYIPKPKRPHDHKIDDLNDQRPRVVTVNQVADRVGVKTIEEEMASKRTDLQQIAYWAILLTYTDMKQFATEMLAGDRKLTTPAEVADAFEDWARKKTDNTKSEPEVQS